MTWTPSGSILLKTDWQYTEPIVGSYFKLKHSSFPVNNSYLVAQAQVNLDGSVELAEVCEFQATGEETIICLKAPPVFSDRRLAIKRVATRPSFASELRRVIRNDLLEDGDIEFTQRRSSWSVEIESSDYVEPVATGGGTTTPTGPVPVVLTFVSNGDAKGLFYYLGTDSNTQAFANPTTIGKVTITASSQFSTYVPSNLVSRSTAFYHSNGAVGSSFKIDLGANKKLVLKHYTILGRPDSNANHPRNWKFQGSNDDAIWTDLDEQVNNTSINQNTYFSKSLPAETAGHRYFRLITTGVDSSNGSVIVASEIELYGTLTTTT